MCYMHYMRIHQHINARRKIRREITISTARYMNKPIDTNQLFFYHTMVVVLI